MKNLKVFLVLIIVIIVYLSISSNSTFVEKDQVINAYNNQNLTRFHVVANSNSPEDQYVKRILRNKITEKNIIFENEQITEKDIEKLKIIVDDFLKENKLNYHSEIKTGIYNFPERNYGNIILPSGEYKALKIILGNAQGSNWWCVLFPPLCIDEEENKEEDIEKEDLKFKLKMAELLNQEKFAELGFKEWLFSWTG